MKKAVKVAAFGKFEHDFGNVADGAGLAHFVGEELRLLSAVDGGEEFFVNASGAGWTVTHEDWNTEDDRVFLVVCEHFSLGHKFGLPVEVGGGGHVGRAVWVVALAVEDHVGGNVDEAGSEVGAELG